MPRSANRWPLSVAMLAMLLAPIVIVVGVAIGSDSNAPTTPPTVLQPDAQRSVAAPTEPASPPIPNPKKRPDAHQVMLEQMRVNVTPQMVQAMNANPLTGSPENLAEVERQAADMNRMLARQP